MTARLGHGLVMALAVWVLLGPPIRDGEPDVDAPIDAWKLYGRFASEAECVAARDLMRRMTGTEKYGWEKAYWDDLARCEAASD